MSHKSFLKGYKCILIETLKNSNLSKIVFFSVLSAIITGTIIGILSPLYGFALIGFLVFITLTLSNIYHGILFWILTGGLSVVPIYSMRNAGIYPSFLMLCILILVWLFISIEKETFVITQSKLFWPLIFLIITTILSALKGAILYDPDVHHGEHRFIVVQILAPILIIISIITVFLILNFFKTTKQIYYIYIALIFLGIITIFLKIFNMDKFLNWDVLLTVHAMSLSYASLLFIPKLSISKKIGFVLLVIFSFESSIIQFFSGGNQWISGWIALGIPLIYITFQKTKIWSLFIIILIAILFFFLAIKYINHMFIKAEQEGDYDRFIMWETASNIWQKNPILGTGSGNYIDYSATYSSHGFAYTSAHNQYFQILAELGSLGIICFLWILIKISSLGRQLIKTTKDNFLKAFVIGIMGSIYGQILASVFGDYILPSYHNGGLKNICTTIYFWILVGSLMAVEQIVKKEEQQALGSRV